MFDAANSHQRQCLCHCGMSAACVLICCELPKVHAGVVGPDVPFVPVELHVDPEQAIVAGVLENLMFRQLVLCLHPCRVHVNLHVYCTVAPIEEIDVAAGCPLGNVPRIQLYRGHNEGVEVLCPACPDRNAIQKGCDSLERGTVQHDVLDLWASCPAMDVFQLTVLCPRCELLKCHCNVHHVGLVLDGVHVDPIQCTQGLFPGDVLLGVAQRRKAHRVPCPRHCDLCGRDVLSDPCET